jgi:hypothetical protein
MPYKKDILHTMKARLLRHDKLRFADGAILEMIIWQLPQTDSERPHGLKYRLYYGKNGERLVAYDNERGKGDHRHFRDQEYPYNFISGDRLIADFLSDIKQLRSESND